MALLPQQTRVFVGAIPHVTIPPVTQGIPPFDGTYFTYYGRFFASPGSFSPVLQSHLTRAHARQIDQTIDSYNESIRQAVAAQGPRWRVVELGAILDRLAVKRNEATATPDRPLRDYYASLGIGDHYRPGSSCRRPGHNAPLQLRCLRVHEARRVAAWEGTDKLVQLKGCASGVSYERLLDDTAGEP